MTILESDIKLFASQRLSDDADGGGRMSAVVVQDGVDNNLFPDIATLNRAQGTFHLRKAFLAVVTDNSDTLLGSHLILDDVPDDPDVSALIFQASGAADDRTEIVAALNEPATLPGLPFTPNPNAGGALRGYYGTKPLLANVAVGARDIPVPSTEEQFLPLSAFSAPASGDVPQQAVVGYVPVGGAVAMTAPTTDATDNFDVCLSSAYPLGPNGVHLLAGSVSGTYTGSNGAGTVVEDQGQGSLSLIRDGVARAVGYYGYDGGQLHPDGVQLVNELTGGTITGQPALSLARTVQGQQTLVTSANNGYVWSFTLPAGTVHGTEAVAFVVGGVKRYLRSHHGRTTFSYAASNLGEMVLVQGGMLDSSTAVLNRASGALQVLLQALPDPDSTIEVTYAVGGDFAQVPSASLSNSGQFQSGQVTVTLTAGYRLATAAFRVAGIDYFLSGTTILRLYNNQVSGSYNPATRVISMPFGDGTPISAWYAIEDSTTLAVSSVTATLPAGMEPQSLEISGTEADDTPFTATANEQGVFATALVSGQYVEGNGALSLAFTSPVHSFDLEYAGNLVTYSPTGIDLGGLASWAFPATGKVPIFKQGAVVVLHRTQSIGPQTVVDTQTIDIPEVRVARVRVIGNNGTVIATFSYGAPPPSGVGCSADLDAGSVTFNDVSGYSQPVTVEYRIEDMATVAGINADGSVRCNRPVSHAYTTAANSKLSSALLAGDLNAVAHDGFSQQTWTGVWSDALIGSGINAEYQQAAYPIAAKNQGAITERWALIFTNTTAFRVVGETVGEILISNTAEVCAPVNPITGGQYFSINPLGWGSGWAAGNVFRFNTDSATHPVWVSRTVMPSDPSAASDSLTLGLRGDIDV